MGLWASVSIRRAASSVVSVPVHGWAEAICWVPLPALDYALFNWDDLTEKSLNLLAYRFERKR